MKAILKLLALIVVAPFAPIIAGCVLFVVVAFFCVWWELVKYIWGDTFTENAEEIIVFILIFPVAFLVCSLMERARVKWRGRGAAKRPIRQGVPK